jgi:hypothetical protein
MYFKYFQEWALFQFCLEEWTLRPIPSVELFDIKLYKSIYAFELDILLPFADFSEHQMGHLVKFAC